jgi:hypothetical protein
LPRYRQILVHAGLSKTGSTSIQYNCKLHSDYLRQQGVVYPRFHFGEKAFSSHSIPIVAAFVRSPGFYVPGIRSRYGEQFDDLASACSQQLDRVLQQAEGEVLLLSTELLEGFADEDMQALRARLEPHADELRVVTFIRSPQSSLESLLQERLKAGALVKPEALVGRVRKKYENLQRTFPDVLEIVNYHRAVDHPHGLVGAFLALLGLSETDMSALKLGSRNERMCMEAFRLMTAINQDYPGREQALHKVERTAQDLNALLQLPGQPFQLKGFAGSQVYQACLEEAAWLEQQLGFHFPLEQFEKTGTLWQQETLAVLAGTIKQLKAEPLRQCAADCLRAEGQLLRESRPETAQQLEAIAGELSAGGEG